MQNFQNLSVWRRADAFGLRIDVIVRRFPRRGYGPLRAQLSRSADSIAATIVEGCGAATQREFARYLDIAIKSSSETEHHVMAARKRGLIKVAASDALVDEVSQIRRMLYGLRKAVLRDLTDEPNPPATDEPNPPPTDEPKSPTTDEPNPPPTDEPNPPPTETD